eukprot:scaffold94451_cov78-Phaeocystis_antarctica.AAC.2
MHARIPPNTPVRPRTVHAPDIGDPARRVRSRRSERPAAPLLRAPTQVPWRCSGRRAQWPTSIARVAAYHPLPKPPWAAISRCARRGPWASLDGPPEWPGHLKFVPGWLERENRILEAATEPPAGGFGACGARAL